MKTYLLIFALILSFSIVSFAQWSSDPSVNTSIAIASGEIKIYPDTLICDIDGPHYVTIKNNTLEDVQIEDINIEFGWCQIEELPPLPYDLTSGDSLELVLWVISGVYTPEGYVDDTLNIITNYGNYELIIYINHDLLGKVKEQNGFAGQINIFPNPSNGIVCFDFNFDQCYSLSLNIYNSIGTKIKHYEIKNPSDFNNLLIWDGTNENNQKVQPGTYYYRIISDEFQESGKIILLD